MLTKLLVLTTIFISVGEPPSVVGHVFYNGNPTFNTIRDNDGTRRPLIHVHPKNKGVKDVVVYIKNPPEFSKRDKSKEITIIDQFMETFEPHVTIARPDEKIDFTNSDALNHNVRADGDHLLNKFNVVSTPARTYTKSFKMESVGTPIPIACDIHPWMKAWVYVFEHPYAVLTDDSGNFTLPRISPGVYTLVVEYPDLEIRSESRITLPATTPINIELRDTKEN